MHWILLEIIWANINPWLRHQTYFMSNMFQQVIWLWSFSFPLTYAKIWQLIWFNTPLSSIMNSSSLSILKLHWLIVDFLFFLTFYLDKFSQISLDTITNDFSLQETKAQCHNEKMDQSYLEAMKAKDRLTWTWNSWEFKKEPWWLYISTKQRLIIKFWKHN